MDPTSNPVVRLWQNWIKPLSTDQDEAFRERTLRITSGILLILDLLNLIIGIVVFHDPVEPISLVSLNIVIIALCIISIVAILKRKLDIAGWVLVVLVLIAALSIGIVLPQLNFVSIPLFMLSVLASALVLSQSTVIPTAIIAVVLSGVSAQIDTARGISILGDSALSSIFISLFLLMAEALFLRQLRSEFDARLVQANKARDDAERANKAKSQFLANMSHELRTPLNAVRAYVQIILANMVGEISDKQRELLGYVDANGARLLDLINDVLDLAKIESGSMDVYPSVIEPRKLITGTIDEMRGLAKGISLDINIALTTPESVVCDSNKLKHIVTNLVGNAIKFTKEGGVTVETRAQKDNFWAVIVRDTGVGMPPDAKDYIFEKFRQVDGTDTRQHGGTGLGLSITKELVEMMGGTISVESQIGKGSTFTVTLPCDVKKSVQKKHLEGAHA